MAIKLVLKLLEQGAPFRMVTSEQYLTLIGGEG